jgi:predicted DNA-binding WGR domain protein
MNRRPLSRDEPADLRSPPDTGRCGASLGIDLQRLITCPCGSDKFWEITARGAEVSVRFGRNGTNGQTTTKAFPDAAAARQHADKLIRQKTGKVYVSVA